MIGYCWSRIFSSLLRLHTKLPYVLYESKGSTNTGVALLLFLVIIAPKAHLLLPPPFRCNSPNSKDLSALLLPPPLLHPQVPSNIAIMPLGIHNPLPASMASMLTPISPELSILCAC
jgi:hypothetical protein